MMPHRNLHAKVVAGTKQFGPKLDANDEPRFLEQVKLYFKDAAN